MVISLDFGHWVPIDLPPNITGDKLPKFLVSFQNLMVKALLLKSPHT